MKKTALAVILISTLLFSAVAGRELVKVAEANPFFIFEEIEPIQGTIPPTITISSPQNNIVYSSDEVTVSFHVDKPQLGTCGTAIINVTYTIDSKTVQAFSIWRGNSASSGWAVPEFDTNFTLTSLTVGNHRLTVRAEGVVYAGDMDIFFIKSFSTVTFTTSNTHSSFTLLPTPTPSPSLTSTYFIHQDHTQVSVQSPTPDGFYEESTVPLVVNVSLTYGTTTALDEFAFESLTCRYSLDNREWKNITSINITSNEAQPDINYWNGLLHELNFTCSTTLQDLCVGSHSVNFTLISVDSRGTYSDTSQTYFTINMQPEPFPTTLVIGSVIAVVAVVGLVSLVYFKKRSQLQRN